MWHYLPEIESRLLIQSKLWRRNMMLSNGDAKIRLTGGIQMYFIHWGWTIFLSFLSAVFLAEYATRFFAKHQQGPGDRLIVGKLWRRKHVGTNRDVEIRMTGDSRKSPLFTSSSCSNSLFLLFCKQYFSWFSTVLLDIIWTARTDWKQIEEEKIW